ncbi:putative MFS-type transporter [Cyphellophora attinorum]|uniref:Putative MFS-type transporter n=1 Tax=Cyphellophora attinorum TaxID=1664694 RepID=A0A0N1NWQ3_9EURO|nr:putative MFS-type transporter [Phialophora attinorum]KPI35680.1 putative MFS-type transporter [Phialophora attinorum]
MAFGILEPKTASHVPGTVLLDQQAAHSEATTGRLKHGKGRNSNIVLAPQPSEDPNDPLNWSQMRKYFVISIIFFGVIIVAGVPGPILNPGIVQVAMSLNKDFTTVAQMSGYTLLATGAMGPFVSALGRKYGKRPVYVFSSVIGTVGVIVSETASGYNTLLAGRILQGVGIPAYESLAISSIGDLFFVHERGALVAIVIFLLAAISNGVLPFAALQTILVILFVEETSYNRRAIYEIDTAGSEENLEKLAEVEGRAAQHLEKRNAATADRDVEQDFGPTITHTSTVETIPPRKTFVQRLALYNGTYTEDSVFKMALASVAILLNAGAAYQVFSTGFIIAWYVAVAIISGVIFASPPYLLGSAAIGYLSAGPLIGGLLGSAVPFFVTEPFIKALTRRNNGYYEPEFCLIPTTISGVITVAGLVGWGFTVHNGQSIYLAAFLWGLMLFGMAWFATSATSWALDAYRQNSTEVFIMNMVFKNFFYYGLTNYVIDWYLGYGAIQMVGIMSGVVAFWVLMAIPLYVFGKRYRLWWHKHNALKALKLETQDNGGMAH